MLLMALMMIAAQDGGVIARQKTLSVAEVLGGKVKLSDIEKDALKEAKRHNKAVERQLEEIRKDNSLFTLPQKARKPVRTKSLPANSNRY